MTEDGKKCWKVEGWKVLLTTKWMLLISGDCFVGLHPPPNDIKALTCPE